MRIQVIVAHPDDETFGCGSLILHAKAIGATVGVVCATRGEAGGGADAGGDLGAVREAELRAAAGVLGVDEVAPLGFGDSGMSGEAAPGTLAAADGVAVREAVQDAVNAFTPDLLVTLDGSDGHRDHAVVRDAALAVADARGLPAYLVCLPRSLMQRWVAHASPEREHLDADTAGLGTPDDAITTVLDVAAHLPDRERAIAEHRSQQSPYDGLPDELYRAFLERVYLLRARPGASSSTDPFA